MQLKIAAALCAGFLWALTLPARADQIVTMNVPVTMSNIPASIAQFKVQCYFNKKDGTVGATAAVGVPIINGRVGNPPAPADVQIPVTVSSIVAPLLDGTYSCVVAFYAANMPLYQPGLSTSDLAPLISTPPGSWQVQGRLWPAAGPPNAGNPVISVPQSINR